MTYWYYRLGTKQAGAASVEMLVTLVRAGTIKPDTLLWHAGLRDWQKASETPELVEALAKAPMQTEVPANPRMPGKLDARDQALAGPWTRILARSFDSVIIMIALGPVISAMSLHLMEAIKNNPSSISFGFVTVYILVPTLLILLLSAVVFATIMTFFGTTPGKAIVGIRVESLSGELGSKGERFRFFLRREFGLLMFGCGLGIPIIAHIAAFLQFRRVRAGRPTYYDENKAVVRGNGSLERWCIALALMLFLGWLNGAINTPESLRDLAVNPQHFRIDAMSGG